MADVVVQGEGVGLYIRQTMHKRIVHDDHAPWPNPYNELTLHPYIPCYTWSLFLISERIPSISQSCQYSNMAVTVPFSIITIMSIPNIVIMTSYSYTCLPNEDIVNYILYLHILQLHFHGYL